MEVVLLVFQFYVIALQLQEEGPAKQILIAIVVLKSLQQCSISTILYTERSD
jgi:hypothetical protein